MVGRRTPGTNIVHAELIQLCYITNIRDRAFDYCRSLFISKLLQRKQGKLIVDTNILKIPLFGDLLLRSEMAGMCDTLSTLVNSGIPIVDGMQRCISASSNELIRQTLQRSILLVTQGQELNYSMGRNNVFPKLVISMIRIGEETGQLSFMLEKLLSFTSEKWNRQFLH